MRFVILLCTLFVWSTAGLAQSEEPPAPSVEPRAMLGKLEPLVGRWTLSLEYSANGGDNWTKYPNSIVEVGHRLKGLALAETTVSAEPGALELETYFSYDQYRDVYRLAVLDDTFGVMDIYEGRLDDNALIVTNLKAGTFFPTQDGRELAFRLTIAIDPVSRDMIIDASLDGGETWFPYFRARYERLKDGEAR